jgi:tetratricopeptide (TPR) repeat protein
LHTRRRILAVALGLVGVLMTACSSGSGPSGSATQLINQGLSAERAGNLPEALLDYEAATNKDPGNKVALYDLAYVDQIQGHRSDATAAYLQALGIDPRFTQALYNMGVLETETNPSSAISYYRRELQVDPNDPSGNFNLGVLLVKAGQSGEGDIYIEQGVRLNPSLASELPPGISLPGTAPTTTSTTVHP